MSDDKTEKATPRRRQKAREEGQVSKSADLSSAVVLTVGMVVIFVLGTAMLNDLKNIMISNLSTLNVDNLGPNTVFSFIVIQFQKIVMIVGPLMAVLMIVGVISNLAQIGPLLSSKAIQPSLKKLNPVSGVKRLFSLKSIVELIKGVLKMAVVGLVCYYSIYPRRAELMVLSGTEVSVALGVIMSVLIDIIWKVCLILIFIGIVDFYYQKYEFEKSIKMSKQDVKDEYKNIEGDPKIKGKIKATQRQMAMSWMMKEIPDADVVVTNPTHYAVALKYDTEKAPAPMVIAKGVDHLAKRIKDIAKNNKVPIVENKPLAQSLFKTVELNHMVPEELFVAVAEVLAYVYKKNKAKYRKKQAAKPKQGRKKPR